MLDSSLAECAESSAFDRVSIYLLEPISELQVKQHNLVMVWYWSGTKSIPPSFSMAILVIFWEHWWVCRWVFFGCVVPIGV